MCMHAAAQEILGTWLYITHGCITGIVDILHRAHDTFSESSLTRTALSG